VQRLVVGDIHGCYREFMELLDRAALAATDEIIALGDIIDRGPESRLVLDFFRSNPQARSLMGNHERKHIRTAAGETRPALSQKITRFEIGSAYQETIDHLKSFPYLLDLDEAILVHGFLEPGVALERQLEMVVSGTKSGEAYLKRQYERPWYELIAGDKPVIVGHLDYLQTGEPFVYKDYLYAIDTGCYAGRRLTAVLLPDFKIISVPARKDYWQAMKSKYAWIRYEDLDQAALAGLTWEEVGNLVSARQDQSLPAAVSNRLAGLDATSKQALEALHGIYDYIDSEHKQILNALNESYPFAELTQAEQGSLFARSVGANPFAPLLHQARRGQLNYDALKQRFRSPAQAINALVTLNNWREGTGSGLEQE